jgi:hypothetical protein
MSRFPTPGDLLSWARFAPRARQSAGRVTIGRGNPWLGAPSAKPRRAGGFPSEKAVFMVFSVCSSWPALAASPGALGRRAGRAAEADRPLYGNGAG